MLSTCWMKACTAASADFLTAGSSPVGTQKIRTEQGQSWKVGDQVVGCVLESGSLKLALPCGLMRCRSARVHIDGESLGVAKQPHWASEATQSRSNFWHISRQWLSAALRVVQWWLLLGFQGHNCTPKFHHRWWPPTIKSSQYITAPLHLHVFLVLCRMCGMWHSTSRILAKMKLFMQDCPNTFQWDAQLRIYLADHYGLHSGNVFFCDCWKRPARALLVFKRVSSTSKFLKPVEDMWRVWSPKAIFLYFGAFLLL